MEVEVGAKTYREPKWDLYLAIALALLGALGLHHDFDLRFAPDLTPRPGGVLKASVLREAGWIRYRPRDSVFWRDLSSDRQWLGQGDAVATGEDGRAELEFSGGRVELSPGTLIVIESEVDFTSGLWRFLRDALSLEKPTSTGISLAQGEARFRPAGATPGILITADDRHYRVRSTSEKSIIRATLGPGSTLHLASEGEDTAGVIQPGVGQEISLHPGQSFEIVLAAPVAPETKPQIPAPIFAPIASVPFHTGDTVTVPPAKPLPLPPLPLLPLLPLHRPVGGSKAAAVQTKARPSSAKPLATVGVKPELVPNLVAEVGQGDTRLKSKTHDLSRVLVTLRWKSLAKAAKYDVTVFDSHGGNPTVHHAVQGISLPIFLSSPEKDRFSYEVATQVGQQKIKSVRMPIRIEFLSPLPKKPADHSSFPPGRDVFVSWEKTALTDSYEIQFSADEKFAMPLVDKTLALNYIFFKPRSDHVYFWRVRSQAGTLQSEWSEIRSFRME